MNELYLVILKDQADPNCEYGYNYTAVLGVYSSLEKCLERIETYDDFLSLYPEHDMCSVFESDDPLPIVIMGSEKAEMVRKVIIDDGAYKNTVMLGWIKTDIDKHIVID